MPVPSFIWCFLCVFPLTFSISELAPGLLYCIKCHTNAKKKYHATKCIIMSCGFFVCLFVLVEKGTKSWHFWGRRTHSLTEYRVRICMWLEEDRKANSSLTQPQIPNSYPVLFVSFEFNTIWHNTWLLSLSPHSDENSMRAELFIPCYIPVSRIELGLLEPLSKDLSDKQMNQAYNQSKHKINNYIKEN